MESQQKWLLVVPMMVLLSTLYVACSADENEIMNIPDSGIDGRSKPESIPDGSITNWSDSASDADLDADQEDAPFSGTG